MSTHYRHSHTKCQVLLWSTWVKQLPLVRVVGAVKPAQPCSGHCTFGSGGCENRATFDLRCTHDIMDDHLYTHTKEIS